MRLRLIIDNFTHEIDTTDPDLLGRWIVEIFGRMRDWNPATDVRMQAGPSYFPEVGGAWTADWLTDSRIIAQQRPILSPRDLVAELGKILDESDNLPRD
jgi:hypothetical protein